MKVVKLSKILNADLLKNIALLTQDQCAFWVVDAQGKILFNTSSIDKDTSNMISALVETREKITCPNAVGFPIITEHQFLGAVIGKGPDDSSKALSGFIRLIVDILEEISYQEIVQKMLTSDSLEKYREINLLYRINETLSSCFDLDKILKVILNESLKIINAKTGFIIFVDEKVTEINLEASLRFEGEEKEILEILKPFIDSVLKDKDPEELKPEIINDITKDPRRAKDQEDIISLVLAPLKTTEKKFGAIVLANKAKDNFFTANDMSLLSSIAMQTALAIANINLVQALIQAERMSTIGRLTSTIIHDIKNPMFVIKSFAEFLSDPKLKPEKRSLFLKLIRSESDRLMSMASEILEYSRGEMILNCQECSLKEVLEEVSMLLEQDFKAKDIEYKLSIDCDRTVNMDADKIKRVFFNIAANAKDAMKKGGIFEIKTNSVEKELQIVFKDTGPGMKPEIQKKIFEPFFTSGKKHGTGLGMPIVKRIVEAHQGTITFESELGKGTTFYITLPLNSVD